MELDFKPSCYSELDVRLLSNVRKGLWTHIAPTCTMPLYAPNRVYGQSGRYAHHPSQPTACKLLQASRARS